MKAFPPQTMTPLTPPTTTSTALHDKENNNNINNKRKADIPRSIGRRAVVFSPNQEPPAAVVDWREALRQRRVNVLTTTDCVVHHLVQVATGSESISNNSHKLIQDAVQEEMGNAETILNEVEEFAIRVQHQIDQDDQALTELQGSLDELIVQQTKLNAEIGDLEQEVIRLRMENMSLDETMQTTASQMTAQQKLEAKRHRRTLHQLTFFKRLSGIIWDYPSIEKDSNRLVGQVNIPSKKTFREFEFNLIDDSPYVIANSLWRMMDGEEPLQGH